MLPKARHGWSTLCYADGYSAFYKGHIVYIWDYNPNGEMWQEPDPLCLSDMIKNWEGQGYKFINREDYLAS